MFLCMWGPHVAGLYLEFAVHKGNNKKSVLKKVFKL